LKSKTALVTGGSSGIGLGVVKYFAKCGVRVINGDIREPPAALPGVQYQRTDASDWDDLLSLFRKAIELWGRIDIVVPNAGIIDSDMKHVSDSGEPVKPEFTALKVNLIGQMYTTKLAMHYMRKQQPQGGVIISTVSRDGYEAVGLPVYAASKHGMIGLMRALKRGSLAWNIRINSIAPSVTDSAMTRFIPTVIPDCERVGIPVSTPEDVAKAVALLAVDEKYNGHTISVDGQSYRELESGFEKYNKELMGTHTENAMTKEQLDVMSRWFKPFRRASANGCRRYRSIGVDVVRNGSSTLAFSVQAVVDLSLR
jgi:NAD(P)-dependent dehydrogenase (short-subunit alcohol dehydrogenase family)